MVGSGRGWWHSFVELVEEARQDWTYAIRWRRRRPTASVGILAVLSLGIASNVVLVNAAENVMLRPAEHVRDPHHVVRLFFAGRASSVRDATAAANYPRLLDFQRDVSSFEAVEGFTSRQTSLGRGSEAVEIRTAVVSAGFFATLGVNAVVGRIFQPSDGYPSSNISETGPPLALLSHEFWSTHFGADTAMVGQKILVGELFYTIVGVLPSRFRGVAETIADLWLPITVVASDPTSALSLDDRSRYSLSIVARLRRGVTTRAAEEEATAVAHRRESDFPVSGRIGRVIAAPIIRGRAPNAPLDARIMVWLSALSVVMLVLTIVNVMSLMLADYLSRRHEATVRIALGATPARLIRQVFIEAMVLAVASGAAALLVSVLVRSFAGQLAATEALSAPLSGRAIGLLVLVCIASATIVIMVPASQAWRDANPARSSSSASTDRRATAIRHSLLTVQSATTSCLMVLAVTFAMSAVRATSLDLGVDAHRTIRFMANFERQAIPSEELDQLYDEILRRIRAVPGVQAAAIASSDPYSGGRAVAAHTREQNADHFWPPGVSQVPIEASVGDGFFTSVGASLRGRDFLPTDLRGAERVAIINQPLSQRLFAKQDPIGQCVYLPNRADDRTSSCVRIVGVLTGVWYVSLTNRDKPMVYVPLAQRTGFDGITRPRGFFVRAVGNPTQIVSPVRRALQSARMDLPAVRAVLLRDLLASQTRPWRLGAIVFGSLGAAALVIAIVGLYAVVSLTVRQRSRELAIRLALGARPFHIATAVTARSLAMIAIGILIGVTTSAAATSRIDLILFQSSSADPAVLLGVSLILITFALLAGMPPVVRSLRGEHPSAALRNL